MNFGVTSLAPPKAASSRTARYSSIARLDIRHVLFRDWLCGHPEDRERYAEIKLKARLGVDNVQEYNRNKQAVVRMIYQRIFEHHQWKA